MMIQLKNIHKQVQQAGVKTSILESIDLHISSGDFLSIMGPSGSGKSSLLNILGLLDVASSGDYFFNGENVRKLGSSQLSAFRNKKVGFVFQSFMLIPRLSVRENVEVPLLYSDVTQKQKAQRMEQALEQVGMLHKAKEPIYKLSGGQKQKVAIARAIINQPDLLLADEPTGNLDQVSKEEILQIFQQLNGTGKTIVLVTHDIEVANVAQRILVMKNGRWAEPVMEETGRAMEEAIGH
jgi:putative ABC transport system ATP-binding protein